MYKVYKNPYNRGISFVMGNINNIDRARELAREAIEPDDIREAWITNGHDIILEEFTKHVKS